MDADLHINIILIDQIHAHIKALTYVLCYVIVEARNKAVGNVGDYFTKGSIHCHPKKFCTVLY